MPERYYAGGVGNYCWGSGLGSNWASLFLSLLGCDWFCWFGALVVFSVVILGCLLPGLWAGFWFVSPLPGVWACFSLVGSLLACLWGLV